jgi:3-oxoadipate enol-lactonase
MPQIEVNGTQIYYELHGPEDAEVLVLSNGVLMSTASWGLQTPVLSNYFRVLTYDCRGMWRSAHPVGPYSMEMHADDLAALMDGLEIEKAHIAGISYGSEVSMTFAIKYPDMTKTLIVADGVSQIDPLLKQLCDTWVMAAQRKDPELLLKVTAPLNFSEAWLTNHQAVLESLVEKYEKLDFDAFLELMDCFYGLDLTGQLHQVSAPALVMVAEEDILKTRKYSDLIAREIPNTELVVVPNSGHALCLEQPEIFNTLVIGFVVKHSGDMTNG